VRWIPFAPSPNFVSALAGALRAASPLGPEGGGELDAESAHYLHSTRRQKRITFCAELTFHSPFSTPLLPAPTLTAGECKMKVSRRVSLLRTMRSSLEAQIDLPLILVAFSRLPLCCYGGATGFLPRVYGPCCCQRDSCVCVCRLRLIGLSCSISSTTISLLYHILHTTAAMARKTITGSELNTRAKANSPRDRSINRLRKAETGSLEVELDDA
jgi:hypothetical protein